MKLETLSTASRWQGWNSCIQWPLLVLALNGDGTIPIPSDFEGNISTAICSPLKYALPELRQWMPDALLRNPAEGLRAFWLDKRTNA